MPEFAIGDRVRSPDYVESGTVVGFGSTTVMVEWDVFPHRLTTSEWPDDLVHAKPVQDAEPGDEEDQLEVGDYVQIGQYHNAHNVAVASFMAVVLSLPMRDHRGTVQVWTPQGGSVWLPESVVHRLSH